MILNGILKYGVSFGQRKVINRIGIRIIMDMIDWEFLDRFILVFLFNH